MFRLRCVLFSMEESQVNMQVANIGKPSISC